LAAAIDLARLGCRVTVLERSARPGGKMRAVPVGNAVIDGGPTVFTMRWIFEGLFADAGVRLEDRLTLVPAGMLARHAWASGGELDLHADVDRSAEAIAAFAGPREADGYRALCRDGAAIFDTLKTSFIAAERPSQLDLVRRVGVSRLPALLRMRPWQTLWQRLGSYFSDPRLRQLFGRYSTYVGSSPLLAPSTIMLIAHVEQSGVWLVDGGMRRLAEVLRDVAVEKGATVRVGAEVAEILVEGGGVRGVRLSDGERIDADAVVFNGDVSALGLGLLGDAPTAVAPPVARMDRSLSAVTWCMKARTSGFRLAHHTVFFADDYPDEFDAVFRRRTIVERPTVYVCAQDRDDAGRRPVGGAERLLLLVNAPADGDLGFPDAPMLERTLRLMADCGLAVEPDDDAPVVTGPVGFDALFPGSGGALYGRAGHGASATFARPGATTAIRGLYLAGGSVHPGAGVPMATMSGRIAAARLARDAGLTR
jgi:1-hydroxycarotenoid 3,4-desaturase